MCFVNSVRSTNPATILTEICLCTVATSWIRKTWKCGRFLRWTEWYASLLTLHRYGAKASIKYGIVPCMTMVCLRWWVIQQKTSCMQCCHILLNVRNHPSYVWILYTRRDVGLTSKWPSRIVLQQQFSSLTNNSKRLGRISPLAGLIRTDPLQRRHWRHTQSCFTLFIIIKT